MALEHICGLSKTNYLKRRDRNSIYSDMANRLVHSSFNSPYSISAPTFDHPMERLAKLDNPNYRQFDVTHGTTTLAFKYQGGIVMAVDSRGTVGKFVCSQVMRKVVQIDKHILGTIAGCAADCYYWDRVLMVECRLFRLTNKYPPPIWMVAKAFQNIVAHFKNTGLCMGMILASYEDGEPVLIEMDSNGKLEVGDRFAVGSGATYAEGVMESCFEYDMSDEEAYRLAMRCIYHATLMDAFSGGMIRVYHMKPDDWEVVTVRDCEAMTPIFMPENGEEEASLEEFLNHYKVGFVPDPDEDKELRNRHNAPNATIFPPIQPVPKKQTEAPAKR